MEIEDIPPTTLKPAPVIVACEIVTAAELVFVRVRVWELLEPVLTVPKVRLVAFAASDPEDALFVFWVAAGVPAPVRPVQPETDKAARSTMRVKSEASGV